MLGNLFKRRSHYVFDYKPRYYDERKERIEKLKKQYSKSDETLDSEIKSISIEKDNLRAQWSRNNRKVSNRNSNIRLAIILAIIVGIVSYIFEIHTLF